MKLDYGVVTVRDAILEDAAVLASRLRAADLRELEAVTTKTPQQAIEEGIKAGQAYTAVLSTGEIVAVFGVAPTIEPRLGAVWLLASDDILKIRLTFLRHSRAWLSHLFSKYSLLGNYVDARNELHVSWLKWLGFRFLRKAPLGRNGEEFYEFVKLHEQ